ncbi:unnamed protein product [Closterium sp. NIES-53]
MASLRVLAFDHEGRPLQFDTCLNDLLPYLLSDSRDSVSLFDQTSGAAPAPPATADSATRSQWLTRDAAARLAIRNHLPLAKCAHFGQHRTARTLYDAVFARYSSPATAPLGRLLLPYLFPELTAFATVEDLVSHLRASDTSLQLRLVRMSGLLLLVRSAAAARARVEGVVEGAAGVVLGAAVEAVAAIEVVAAVGVVEGVGASVAAVEAAVGVAVVAAVAVVAVGLELSVEVLEEASGNGSGSSVGARPLRLSSFTCGKTHTQHRCFSRHDDAWRAEFGDEVERPHWAELLRSGVAIFDLDYDAILSALYALSASAEGDYYQCVPPIPGIDAAPLGASDTTLTPLPAPVPVRLADPSGGPVVARSSTALPCLADLSSSLSGLRLPSFSTNLVSTAALEDAMVTSTTPWGHLVSICTCTRTGRHLATFTRRLGSSLYTLATEPPQVAASSQVSASGQVAHPCSCRLLSHQTLMWHHRLGHPSLPRLRGMHSRLLVSGLPRYLPPLPPSPAPPCLPCIEGRQHATPHSSSFPPTTAPLQTLHMDVWGPARGGEFSSDLLRDFCRGEGITQSFTLPDSPQQNGIAECRIRLVMELNLWPRVSFPETSPTLRWTGKVGDASVFRVWGSRAFVRDTFTDKLSARAIPCVFVGFTPCAPGWQFCHPTSRRVFPSQDVTFDELVPFFRLFPFRSAPPPPPPLFLAPGPPPVDPLPQQGLAPSVVSPVDPLPGTAPVQPGGAKPEGVEPGGAESEGAESGGAESEGAESGGGATGAGGTGAAGAGDAGVPTGAGGTGGTVAIGPGGARTRGTRAAGTSSVGGTRAGDPKEPRAAKAGGSGTGGAGAGGAEAGGTGAGGAGAGGAGVGGTCAGGTGAGTVRPRSYFVPLLQQVLGVPSSTILTPPLLCPPPDKSQLPLQQASPLPAPSPYTQQSGGLTKRREPASCYVSPVLTTRRVTHSGPPPVPGTHAMALCPFSVPLHIPLPAPPESSLPELPDPESDHACAASPTVSRLLATAVTDPSFEFAAAFALVAELLDFAAACRLDYATALIAESTFASPPSVGGECALRTDILEDMQEDFEYLAAAVPRFASMMLAPEGDPDAPDIPTPRSYAEAIMGPYSSQWQAAMDAEMASWKVKRPPGSPPAFKARYVARGFSQRQGVPDLLPHPKDDYSSGVAAHRYSATTLAALGIAHSTADPSLFLHTATSLPPFYVLVYVDDLVFATADTEALTLHSGKGGQLRKQGHERYFLLVVDDYSRYTTVFPLRRKGEVTEVLIDWIRGARRQLSESFGSDLPVLRLHSDRGGEFSSDLLRAFCGAEGIRKTFGLPASPQQNGIAERRIGMVMDVARTSMIHAAAPHFLWPFAVQYAAHQINLQPRVFLPKTTPTLRWTGKVSDASVFHPVEPVEVAVDSDAARGAEPAGAGPGGAEPGVAESEGAEPGGAQPERVEPGGAEPGGAESGGAEPGGAEPERADDTLGAAGATGPTAGGASGAGVAGGAAGAGAAGAGAAGATDPRGADAGGIGAVGGPAGVGAAGGAGAAGPRGARTGGTGAARAGGAAGVGASFGDHGAEGSGAVSAVSGGAARLRPYYVPLLQQVLGLPPSTGPTPPLLSPPPVQSQSQLQPASPLSGPSPYSGPTRGLTERREPESRPALPESRPASPESRRESPVCAVCAGLRVPRQRPPLVPGTHSMTLRPSTAPQRVPLPSPPASSLPDGPDPESDSLRAASPTVTRFLATAVTDPSFESTDASPLVAELVDFAATCCLDDAASLVAESESASVCPLSVGGECALERQEEFECFAAALPHLVSLLLAPEGDPDAPDILTPRSYAEAIEGPYFSQWQTAMDAEMASLKSTGTYIDEVPPPGANIVSGMWVFRGVDFFQTFSPTPKMTTLRVLLHVVAQRDYELHSLEFSTAFLHGSLHKEIWLRRPPGFTGSFPAGTQWSLRRPVYGLRQAPREWHDILRTTLAALDFAPSTADPSLFLRTDTTLPPFYVLVYVDDLVFATADTKALAHVKSELQKRHMCTDLGELTIYLGLRITRDRAQRTITLTQSHMVHQVLQRFGFTYSSPQSTPLPTGHLLSAPPSDESVEPNGLYPELVGCLIHRKEHMDAAKRVLRYLCSTSGIGLVLGGRARVVLTGHADASWAEDLTTQRSSQGYTFSLGSDSVSWRSTRSSSVLSSSFEAEIYAGAMAAQELRWLTYLLTDLGEASRSPPVLYVDNKAMIALCLEHRLEHRTKHIALRYFLAQELQQRGQLRLAYVASRANTADVFTKALQPCDHQRFCTVLGLVPTVPHLLTS